jgi:hypothetical protein
MGRRERNSRKSTAMKHDQVRRSTPTVTRRSVEKRERERGEAVGGFLTGFKIVPALDGIARAPRSTADMVS